MNINIDVEDINKINSRKIHELTMTQESTIQFKFYWYNSSFEFHFLVIWLIYIY